MGDTEQAPEKEPEEKVSFRSFPRVYFELVFVGFIIIMGMGLSSSFLPIFAEELDPSGGILVGLVVSSWFLSRIFVELPGGIISDRIGRRKLLLLGIGLSAVGAAICSQSKSIYMLILGRSVWGLGTSFYFMNNTALIIDLFSPKIRGQALGTFQGVEFIGSFVGAPIGAFLAEFLLARGMGYGSVFYFTRVLVLGSLVLALSSRNLKKVDTGRGHGTGAPIGEVLSTLRNLGIAAICIMSLSRMLIMQGIFQTVFELYLKNGLLYDEIFIGIVISFRTVGHIVAVILAGWLSDRFGRKPILMAGYAIGALSLAAYPFARGFEGFFLVGFLAGFGEGFEFTTLIVLLTDISPPRMRGGAIGLYRTFMSVGGVAGPIVFTSIYDGLGAQSVFFTAVAINVFNAFLLLTIRADKTRAPEKEGEEVTALPGESIPEKTADS
jgi:DHA1 family multidrug resistance protein-like MFS transporter